MRFNSSLIVLFFLALFIGGCDSNDPTLLDRLAGEWAVSEVSDDNGTQTSDYLANFDELTFRMRRDQSLTVFVEFNATGEAKGYTDIGFDGIYSIETDPVQTLYLDFSGSTPLLETTFAFDANDNLTFSGPADVLHTIIGGPRLTGVFKFTLEKS